MAAGSKTATYVIPCRDSFNFREKYLPLTFRFTEAMLQQEVTDWTLQDLLITY